MEQHLNPMTALNSIIATILFFYTLHSVFVCRNSVRREMIVFAGIGLLAFIIHALVVVDQVIADIFCWQTVTNYMIRPLLASLMLGLLGAVIRLGWRDDK
jgi:hypothetical protein